MGPSQEIKDAKAKKKKKQGELDIDEGDRPTVPKGSAGRREPGGTIPPNYSPQRRESNYGTYRKTKRNSSVVFN